MRVFPGSRTSTRSLPDRGAPCRDVGLSAFKNDDSHKAKCPVDGWVVLAVRGMTGVRGEHPATGPAPAVHSLPLVARVQQLDLA